MAEALILDGDRDLLLSIEAALCGEEDIAVARENAAQDIATYRERCEQAARDKRDAEWREAADNSFEDIQSNEALLSVFPDLPEAVMHEVWKRDPRVQAARDEISKASGAFLEAWDSAESNRGCYSCCDEHDCRCRTRYAKPEPCNCGRVELNATGEALRLTLDPDRTKTLGPAQEG